MAEANSRTHRSPPIYIRELRSTIPLLFLSLFSSAFHPRRKARLARPSSSSVAKLVPCVRAQLSVFDLSDCAVCGTTVWQGTWSCSFAALRSCCPFPINRSVDLLPIRDALCPVAPKPGVSRTTASARHSRAGIATGINSSMCIPPDDC